MKMKLFHFIPLNVNAKRKLYASNQQKKMLSFLRNDEFNNNFSFRRKKNGTTIFPTGNEEFNENFL